MKTIIVLSGIHASGKTMLGNSLERQGYTYVPEIVEQFIEKGITTGVSADPLLDEMIMEAEFRRDEQLFLSDKNPLVIETWHVGNIACASLRNPEIAVRYRDRFRRVVRCHYIYGIYLNITINTFLRRTRKYLEETEVALAVEFFRRLEKSIIACYKSLEVPVVEMEAAETVEIVERQILVITENILRGRE